MARLYLATGNAVAVAWQEAGGWRTGLQMEGMPAYCLAADPLRPELLYCGTFGRGLWRSRDAGISWQPAGGGISHREITAVAVSRLERSGGEGVVWAGTEPSALFRSEDGGAGWVERPALPQLPSAPAWSFPPRPWTHHVRWIAPDATIPQRIFVGIELGGVMRSLDAGLTWEDRKPGAQPDAHTPATHTLAPGRVYEVAGGGYSESLDGGDSWRGYDDGLPWRYLWGLAVDPADPENIVVSASPSARQAHGTGSAMATLCRRTAGGAWQEVRAGLPPVEGTRAYVLATSDTEPGVFYAATRTADVYRSPDGGTSWERLPIGWPEGYHAGDVGALVVTG